MLYLCLWALFSVLCSFRHDGTGGKWSDFSVPDINTHTLAAPVSALQVTSRESHSLPVHVTCQCISTKIVSLWLPLRHQVLLFSCSPWYIGLQLEFLRINTKREREWDRNKKKTWQWPWSSTLDNLGSFWLRIQHQWAPLSQMFTLLVSSQKATCKRRVLLSCYVCVMETEAWSSQVMAGSSWGSCFLSGSPHLPWEGGCHSQRTELCMRHWWKSI